MGLDVLRVDVLGVDILKLDVTVPSFSIYHTFMA